MPEDDTFGWAMIVALHAPKCMWDAEKRLSALLKTNPRTAVIPAQAGTHGKHQQGGFDISNK
jgi:hypothetical protein